MARPTKEGLDYFELDCHVDEKLQLIEAEFGLKGFAIVVKLYQHIYGGHGYYCEWNPDISLLWASRCGGSPCGAIGDVDRMFSEDSVLSGFPKNFINEIVAASIRRDIFSKDLFLKYQILTSSGIQKRYINAVSRREKVNLKKEYLLVSVNKKEVSVNKNSVNVNRNSKNADSNTQSRGKKSKEENNVGGYINNIDIAPAPELTDSQLQQILNAWNEVPHTVNIDGIIPMTHRYDETRICISLFGFDRVMEAIRKAESAEWLKNKGKVTFDNFINRNAVQRLLEGAYDEDYKSQKKKQGQTNTSFNNFHQREYDYAALERKLAGR